MLRISIDNPEIGFFLVDKEGKITKSGDKKEPSTWDRTHVNLSKLEVGDYPVVTFNKRDMERIGKDPVYTQLNYKVTKIE